MSIPEVESHLPELMPFINTLGREYESGKLNAWPMMTEKVLSFFSPAMMDKVELILPGWKEMASYVNAQTLIHVTSVLTALTLCPEYQSASPHQQALMKWIVLFHDLGKKARAGKRDAVHGFVSAVLTGKGLPQIGFAINNAEGIETWTAWTANSITKHPQTNEDIQDNSRLPEIMEGIDRLFGVDAALVIKAVLFHMSIDVVSEWPQAAPLTQAEIRQYIDADLFPLLKIMMIVDNDAWAFFNKETKRSDRAETLAAFAEVQKIVML
jgi:hypothetical protein